MLHLILLPFALCPLPFALSPSSWSRVLGSVAVEPSVFVVAECAPASPAYWRARVNDGAFLILEGDSDAARSFGFRPTSGKVMVASVEDILRPRVEIVWDPPWNPRMISEEGRRKLGI